MWHWRTSLIAGFRKLGCERRRLTCVKFNPHFNLIPSSFCSVQFTQFPKLLHTENFERNSQKQRFPIKTLLSTILLVTLTSLGVIFYTNAFLSSFVIIIYNRELPSWLCEALSKAISEELCMEIKFEKLIVPSWSCDRISLLNVKIKSDALTWHKLLTAKNLKKNLQPPPILNKETSNFSYWDIDIGKLDLKISLLKQILSTGFIEEISFKRVRGVIDRSHVYWPPEWKPNRRKPCLNDFEIDKVEIKDAIITIKHSYSSPTFLSIFNAELPLLRKQWLFYDIMRAHSLVGMYDNCLFSLHRAHEHNDKSNTNASEYSSISNFTFKGLDISYLNQKTTFYSAIHLNSATIDLDLKIVFPLDEKHSFWNKLCAKFIPPSLYSYLPNFLIKSNTPNTLSITEMPSFYHRPTFEIITEPNKEIIPHHINDILSPLSYLDLTSIIPLKSSDDIWMQWKIRLNQPKAYVSPSAPEMTYLKFALANSICAFLNSLQTGISMSFVTKSQLSEFDGAWSIYSCGIADLLLSEIWSILFNAYEDDSERSKQLKKIGIHGLRSIAKKVLDILDRVQDPIIPKDNEEIYRLLGREPPSIRARDSIY